MVFNQIKYPVIVLVVLLILPFRLMAAAEIYTGFFSNKALAGYDTVAYFYENMPVKGKAEFTYDYKGTKWLFSSQQNKDKFTAMPEKYAPQYGGYCAWLIAQNDLAKGDPLMWTILDGKLYLNYDAEIQEKWLKDPSGFIEKADAYWPGVLNQ